MHGRETRKVEMRKTTPLPPRPARLPGIEPVTKPSARTAWKTVEPANPPRWGHRRKGKAGRPAAEVSTGMRPPAFTPS